MEVHRPAPGEALNPGGPTEPRQAASVIVLRGGSDALEVLLLRRNPAARFMGGAWVFPGGATDESDVAEGERGCDVAEGERGCNVAEGGRGCNVAEGGPARNEQARLAGETDHRLAGETDHRLAGETVLRRAAVREAAEEAGLVLDAATLVPFSRWITPAQLVTRFDTHFFLAPAPPGQEPRADGAEMVDLCWHAPAAALEAQRRGELQLVFPTIKHLEQLATFATADELLAWAAGREVVAVEPRVVQVTGEAARLLLPGEPGYRDVAAGPARAGEAGLIGEGER